MTIQGISLASVASRLDVSGSSAGDGDVSGLTVLGLAVAPAAVAGYEGDVQKQEQQTHHRDGDDSQTRERALGDILPVCYVAHRRSA